MTRRERDRERVSGNQMSSKRPINDNDMPFASAVEAAEKGGRAILGNSGDYLLSVSQIKSRPCGDLSLFIIVVVVVAGVFFSVLLGPKQFGTVSH